MLISHLNHAKGFSPHLLRIYFSFEIFYWLVSPLSSLSPFSTRLSIECEFPIVIYPPISFPLSHKSFDSSSSSSIMSRFVAMFHKLAADADAARPSPSDLSLSSRILFHEGRRPSSPSSIDHSDSLRKNLLRSKIIQRAHDIKDLDRRSSSSSSLPPLPSFSSDQYTGSSTSHPDDAQSIAANNEALDRFFGDVFFSSRESHSSEGKDADLFCSKQAKIRKMDEMEPFSVHWDSQLFLQVY
ncbi:hypothetical protein PMAYCL1PPCAC_02317 [Pristionchus mayeri]|uniref:Uncharacterized protein n=1 Tax=Pristionchus mayeri TaxID=1317129 RepID=A0AAN4Z054_9BILA|nr:hypothetical protein PMAYCL1PPCAC_02317 [Pristionchus mayeri]